jgi:hypothetical protein
MVVFDRVLAKTESGYQRTAGSPPWLPNLSQSTIASIAASFDHWIRAEYPTLVSAVTVAHELQLYDLCWRIAAHLGPGAPLVVSRDAVLSAFKLGRDAAETAEALPDMRQLRLAEVLVARARFWLTMGMIEQALSDTDAVVQKLSVLRYREHYREQALKILSAAQTVSGLVYETSGVVLDGASLYRQAFESASDGHDRHGRLTAAMLLADARGPSNSLWLPSMLELQGQGDLEFYSAWLVAERVASTEEWSEAESSFGRMAVNYRREAFKSYLINLRLAELQLERWYSTTPEPSLESSSSTSPARPAEGGADSGEEDALVLQAIRRSAIALHNAVALGNQLAELRCRTVIARALLLCGRRNEAELQLQRCRTRLLGVGLPAIFSRAATMQIRWGYAEVENQTGKREASLAVMYSIYQAAEELQDWRTGRAVLARARQLGWQPVPVRPGPTRVGLAPVMRLKTVSNDSLSLIVSLLTVPLEESQFSAQLDERLLNRQDFIVVLRAPGYDTLASPRRISLDVRLGSTEAVFDVPGRILSAVGSIDFDLRSVHDGSLVAILRGSPWPLTEGASTNGVDAALPLTAEIPGAGVSASPCP